MLSNRVHNIGAGTLVSLVFRKLMNQNGHLPEKCFSTSRYYMSHYQAWSEIRLKGAPTATIKPVQ